MTRQKRSEKSRRSYEERYGVDKAKELKEQRRKKAKENKLGSRFSGKTYEEIYGKDKAEQLKETRSEHFKRLAPSNHLRGKTYEEAYGEEKGKELKETRKQQKSWIHTPTGKISQSNRNKNSRYPYRTKNWSCLVKLVRERDDNACQDCGKTGIRLHTHHIIPWHEYPVESVETLITLCNGCHMKWEENLLT